MKYYEISLYFLHLYTETDVFVEGVVMFLCVCTHVRAHTQTVTP